MSESVGIMVVCLSCKNVVWAYDSMLYADIRGILNTMRIPCRLCGEEGNFDGWSIDRELMKSLGAWDYWETMKRLAKQNNFKWEISGTSKWFDEVSPFTVVKK